MSGAPPRDVLPVFDVGAELAPQRAEIEAAIARVVASGSFILGPEVAAFERALAAAAGVGHAVGVSSGTDALLASLMALGIGPGDEVVTTPLSFFATAGAIARVGARPVFAEVDAGSLCLDPAAAAAACTPRTRAILPVHLFGHPARVTAPAGVVVVEDAAHSATALPVRGALAALSFYPTKILGALGDAGAVLTHDPALAEQVRLLRGHGARPKYHHVAVGGNFRLDALQAAVLAVRLPHVPAWIAARRQHAAAYRAALAATRLPAEVRALADHPDHAYHHFVVRAPRRDDLRAHLAAAGFGSEVYYPSPLHLQPCFAALGQGAGSLPVAERACAEVLALPMGPTLPASVPERVVAAIAAFYRS
ncbi:MAG: DegT/DnrJ/EryC1/StrS family aminotransferase [Kofleriaceae bacterium]|jgi:dTDP-4-amino-4,6-dideoxygalactose transaminase|nr:DegT/DnrJ/EryC1/StrS family aminotransferase [Kofleriaceae bacterium]MBP6836850.1 DegT/DnrJ/EryC1/StrS family aminotransferase [Kofleriaceae bacterium]